MAMGERMAMLTDADLLTLTQWLSPAYPVGGFAYSHGLETLVSDGAITDAAKFADWLDAVLRHGAGRSDAILLAAAYRSDTPQERADLDALARALVPSGERLMETDLQGAAFAKVTDALWYTELGPLTFPVAVGAAARARDLPLKPTLVMYLHAFATNLTGAATRLVPLGQTEAQGVLAGCGQTLADLAAFALDTTPDDLGSSAFLADIASMRHETQYSRMFRS